MSNAVSGPDLAETGLRLTHNGSHANAFQRSIAMLGARFALSFTFSAEVLFQLSNFRMSTFVRHLRCPSPWRCQT